MKIIIMVISDEKIYENKYEKKLIEKAIKTLSSKWTLYIIKDMFLGKKHFTEFQQNRPDLDNKSLTRCLTKMEENKLINKNIINNKTEYELSERGLKLNKLFFELLVFTLDTDFENNDYSLKEIESIKENYAKILNIKS